ncbi:MAG: hypothetical protein LBU91_07950, partial [Bacteroidales bacterium]|nr:hypothetical protein [Bacteroidales bacterium]
MKKITSIAIILAAILWSETGFSQTMFTISGKWERQEKVKEITLSEINLGYLEQVATTRMQDDGTFTFAYYPPKEGYYVIGLNHSRAKKNNYVFYFKSGDHLNLVVNDSSYTLVGENTKENIAIAAWHDYVLPLERIDSYSSEKAFSDYFLVLEAKTKQPYTVESTGNQSFEKSFAKFRNFDLMDNAVRFTKRRNIGNPEDKDFIDYYRTLRVKDLVSNTDVLIYSHIDILLNVMQLENRLNGQSVRNSVESLIDMAKNDTIRGELFLSQILADVKEVRTMKKVNAKYEKYIVAENQKARFEQDVKRIERLHR